MEKFIHLRLINKMHIKIFHYLILIIICSINLSYSQNKIVIEFQIEDEIITNIDIIKEKNYLIALNNSLEKLPKNIAEDRVKDEQERVVDLCGKVRNVAKMIKGIKIEFTENIEQFQRNLRRHGEF